MMVQEEPAIHHSMLWAAHGAPDEGAEAVLVVLGDEGGGGEGGDGEDKQYGGGGVQGEAGVDEQDGTVVVVCHRG